MDVSLGEGSTNDNPSGNGSSALDWIIDNWPLVAVGLFLVLSLPELVATGEKNK